MVVVIGRVVQPLLLCAKGLLYRQYVYFGIFRRYCSLLVARGSAVQPVFLWLRGSIVQPMFLWLRVRYTVSVLMVERVLYSQCSCG